MMFGQKGFAAEFAKLTKLVVDNLTFDGATITSDTGAIDFSNENLTTSGIIKLDIDGTAENAAGSLTLGAGNDAGIFFDGTDLVIITNGAGASGIILDSEDDTFEFKGSGTLLATLNTSGLDLAASDNLSFGGVDILADSAGTMTLSNIDALDATTEATIEAAIDSLSNLVTVGALDSGSITSGFGNIDIGASTITTTGTLAAGATSVTGDLDVSAIAYVNDSANANMTIGLTVNSGTNTNEFFTIKQSNTAHGLTGRSETDSLFLIKSNGYAGNVGGLSMKIIAEDSASLDTVWDLEVAGGQAQTTKTTSARGLITFDVTEHDGSNGLANITADGNVACIRARVGGAYVARWLLDEDGDMLTVTAGGTFDEYDDVALLDDLDLIHAKMEEGDAVDAEWKDFIREKEDRLIDLGILGGPVIGMPHDNQGMTSIPKLQRLHNGAIRQLARKHAEQATVIADLTARLTAIEHQPLGR